MGRSVSLSFKLRPMRHLCGSIAPALSLHRAGSMSRETFLVSTHSRNHQWKTHHDGPHDVQPGTVPEQERLDNARAIFVINPCIGRSYLDFHSLSGFDASRPQIKG